MTDPSYGAMLQQAKDTMIQLMSGFEVSHAVETSEQGELFVATVNQLLKSLGYTPQHLKTILDRLTITSEVSLSPKSKPVQVPFSPGTLKGKDPLPLPEGRDPYRKYEKQPKFKPTRAEVTASYDMAQSPMKTAYANLNEDGSISVHGIARRVGG